MNKSKRILDLVNFLHNKYGKSNMLIADHWDADNEAIGLTEKSNQYLAYISTFDRNDDLYFLSLENPPTEDGMPFSPAGEFDNINLSDLEFLVTKHLKIAR